VHFTFKVTSGGYNFNDFSETVPTREITFKIEKTFLVLSSVPVGIFLEWTRAECCSIDSTHLNPALEIYDTIREASLAYAQKPT